MTNLSVDAVSADEGDVPASVEGHPCDRVNGLHYPETAV